MLNEMKERIVVSLKKARDGGELTVEKIRSITHDAVAHTAEATREGTTNLRDIARDAVTAAVRTLQEAGEASSEKITAVVEGTVDGIRRVQGQAAETGRTELTDADTRLRQQKARLVSSVRQALQGATDAAGSFSGDVKTHVETAVTDVRLKNAELLGLTRGAVKHAVKQAIETGTQVEETVVHVTRDATEKALAEGPLIAERVVRVTETVLSGAVDAAEEAGAHIGEVSRAAGAGVRKGLNRAVEKPGSSLSATGKRLSLDQIRSDVGDYTDLFVESLHRVASRTGEAAKNTLTELADEASKAAASIRKKTHDATLTAAERLKELNKEAVNKTAEATGKAAHGVAEETAELGSRMLDVARGAISGVWKGAQKALHKDNKVSKS